MVTTIPGRPMGMANRYEYLGRILRVITNPEIDGVMGTPDIIEELFIVNYILGNPGILDEKVILGCLNRGGLSGTCFEMDDRMTGFTIERIIDLRLDAAKLMLRLDPDNPDTAKTIDYTVEAIRKCTSYNLPVFVEVLPVKKEDGKYKVRGTAYEIAKVVGVANGLGDSSLNTWLKLPYCENFSKVAMATTCPILMLGGDVKNTPQVIKEFSEGMKAGGNVRGALIGRNVLFPAGDEDPLAVALAINDIVHKDGSYEEALNRLSREGEANMDFLKKIWRHS